MLTRSAVLILIVLIGFSAILIDKGWASSHVTQKDLENGNFSKIRHKLEEGANPNTVDQNGASLLWRAASKGNVRLVRLLLSYGADPNLKDLSGKTPLYWPASNGYVSVVRVLVAYGADPNHSGGEDSAIEWAIANHHIAVVRILKDWTHIRRQFLIHQLPAYLDRISPHQQNRLLKGPLLNGRLPYELPKGIFDAPWKNRLSFVKDAIIADKAYLERFRGQIHEPLWRKKAIQEIGQNLKKYKPFP